MVGVLMVLQSAALMVQNLCTTLNVWIRSCKSSCGTRQDTSKSSADLQRASPEDQDGSDMDNRSVTPPPRVTLQLLSFLNFILGLV